MKTVDRYSWPAITLHWLMAAGTFGLFALGLTMVELDYYSSWYTRAPRLHESLGIGLGVLLLLRIALRVFKPPPPPLSSHSNTMKALARWVHGALYLLLIVQITTGYLISSADGERVWLFDWLAIPAIQLGAERQADLAGQLHALSAWTLITLAAIHGLAALKHHVIDGDDTLRRMLGGY